MQHYILKSYILHENQLAISDIMSVVTSVSHGLQKTWLQKTSTESRTMALSTKMHEISIIYLFQNLLIVIVKQGNFDRFWRFFESFENMQHHTSPSY